MEIIGLLIFAAIVYGAYVLIKRERVSRGFASKKPSSGGKDEEK